MDWCLGLSETFQGLQSIVPAREILVLITYAQKTSDKRMCQRIQQSMSQAFIYNTLCMRAAKALAGLRICTDPPEPSLQVDAMSTCVPNMVHWCI